MKPLIRSFLTGLGYVLYTIGVVVILLWLLFPVDSALVWLQGKLDAVNPALTWNIRNIKKSFPLRILLSDISVREKADKEKSLFHIDTIRLAPDIEGLMKETKRIPLLYDLNMLNGAVKGKFSLAAKGSMVECTGRLQDLEIGQYEEFWKETDRTGSGKLSGTFQYSGAWRKLLDGDLQADLKLDDGKFSLQQQIFGLNSLDFNAMTTGLSLRNRIASLTNGTVDSRLFNATFEGTLRLTGNLYTSIINLQGQMEPRPEMLGGLKNPTAVSFIRNQLQNNRLSFTISGTFVEPGIQFKGSSGIIDGMIEGEGK